MNKCHHLSSNRAITMVCYIISSVTILKILSFDHVSNIAVLAANIRTTSNRAKPISRVIKVEMSSSSITTALQNENENIDPINIFIFIL